MNLQEFIGETTDYDKKEALEERRPKSWLKSVSAFANGQGGVLIFGVTDDDRPVGLVDVKHWSMPWYIGITWKQAARCTWIYSMIAWKSILLEE